MKYVLILHGRRDSFITHRAFCDALTEEATSSTKATPLPLPAPVPVPMPTPPLPSTLTLDPQSQCQSLLFSQDFSSPITISPAAASASLLPSTHFPANLNTSARANPPNQVQDHDGHCMKQEFINPWEISISSSMSLPAAYPSTTAAHLSATALLQKAAQMGATMSSNAYSTQTQMASHAHAHANSISNSNPSMLGLVSTNSQQSQLHELMVNRFEFDGSRDGHGLRGGDHHHQHHHVLTRDFLGLRALSQRGILGMPGLDQCMNTNASSTSTSFDQNKESWHA